MSAIGVRGEQSTDAEISALQNIASLPTDTSKAITKSGASAFGQEDLGTGGSPGGSDTQVQFNDGGSFGGDSNFVFDKVNGRVGIGTASPGMRLTVLGTSNYGIAEIIGSGTNAQAGLNFRSSNEGASSGWLIGKWIGSNSNLTFYASGVYRMSLTTGGLLGIGTPSPTHSLTLPSSSTGIALYNTADQTTNYERATMQWSSNRFDITLGKGGTGTNRNLRIGTTSRPIDIIDGPSGTDGFYTFSNGTSSTAVAMSIKTTRTQSSGTPYELYLGPVYTGQTGTAGWSTFVINATDGSGSGTKLLADFQVGGSSKAKIDNTGIITAPQIINTPATITVTSNAGTVTRSNRINNFTNSSAATMTITMSTTDAADGDMVIVRIKDASAAAQTITWVNTENSTVTAPTTSNGSTTLPLTVGFMYNSATSKYRCIASA